MITSYSEKICIYKYKILVINAAKLFYSSYLVVLYKFTNFQKQLLGSVISELIKLINTGDFLSKYVSELYLIVFEVICLLKGQRHVVSRNVQIPIMYFNIRRYFRMWLEM